MMTSLVCLLGATLFFAGDSTLDDGGRNAKHYPYASWGTELEQLMTAENNVANFARSGASTKSFAASGLWAKLIANVKAGDFVAIQFGHNDQKRSNDFYRRERWADPKGLFCEIVRGWVKEVRAKGATPILLSPICRATFDATGTLLTDVAHASDGVCLGSYRDAMHELSTELSCDFVDMNTLTRQLLERLGKTETEKFFVISTGFVKGKDGEPAQDVTHPVLTLPRCIGEHLMFKKAYGPRTGVGIFGGPVQKMPLTVGSFKTEDGRLCGFVTEGEATDDKIEPTFFGTGFVFRKDDGDCQKMLNYMSRNGYRHHVAFVRGNWSAAIVEAFANYLGWEIERV